MIQYNFKQTARIEEEYAVPSLALITADSEHGGLVYTHIDLEITRLSRMEIEASGIVILNEGDIVEIDNGIPLIYVVQDDILKPIGKGADTNVHIELHKLLLKRSLKEEGSLRTKNTELQKELLYLAEENAILESFITTKEQQLLALQMKELKEIPTDKFYDIIYKDRGDTPFTTPEIFHIASDYDIDSKDPLNSGIDRSRKHKNLLQKWLGNENEHNRKIRLGRLLVRLADSSKRQRAILRDQKDLISKNGRDNILLSKQSDRYILLKLPEKDKNRTVFRILKQGSSEDYDLTQSNEHNETDEPI